MAPSRPPAFNGPFAAKPADTGVDRVTDGRAVWVGSGAFTSRLHATSITATPSRTQYPLDAAIFDIIHAWPARRPYQRAKRVPEIRYVGPKWPGCQPDPCATHTSPSMNRLSSQR